ncbi:MAG: DUF616 domain-containing protein [Methanobacteriaceae archaeon]|nr:DUF616 domain-containing protein [Methanobacteriaceae archaeon]
MYEEIYETYKNTVNDHIHRDLFIDINAQPDEDLIEDIKNNKIVIYTAFTGDYDTLKEPEFIDKNCDYVCFTDNPNVESDLYDVRFMEESNLDNNRKAKQYKVLPHKFLSNYKYSFWLDGTFQIKSSLREYIYKYIKNPMLCVVHTERDCIYDEFKASCNIRRYPKAIMSKQINYYKNEGFPKHYGLGVMGSIFRQHNNPEISTLMDDWWNQIIKFTNQDQLSFAYVAWKNNFHPSVSPVYYWENDYWSKIGGENYHHKFESSNSLSSDNLLNYLENNINNGVHLKKEEIYLLLNDIEILKIQLQNQEDDNYKLNKELNKMVNSSSWRLTKPLRDIKRNL